MLLEIAINACAWIAIQLGLVFMANFIPSKYFWPGAYSSERRGQIYSWLGVRVWKNILPDAGSWFPGGFAKRNLQGSSAAELDRFGREASRGELVHWCAIAALPLFTLWNGWSGMLVNAAYSVAANLPCIIVQRYNRARIGQLLRRSKERTFLNASYCPGIAQR